MSPSLARTAPAVLAVLLSSPAEPRAEAALAPLSEPLSPERSRVGVVGAAPIGQAEAEALVFKIAARLASQRGFDWFEPIGEPAEPVESRDAVDPRYRASAPRPDLRLRWANAAPRVGVSPTFRSGSAPTARPRAHGCRRPPRS